MSLMWIPAQTTRPPLRTCFNACGNQRTDGREDDRSVEFLRRLLARSAGPCASERAGEGLRLTVAVASEGEHAPALPSGDLGDDVGGGSEAVKAEPLASAGDLQRAIADQSGAQQRRGLDIVELVGNAQAKARNRRGRGLRSHRRW